MSKLIITLYSDLCAASGTGFSSMIDADVDYDSYGLPLIPARRLKGCLRDAAVYIGIPDNVINHIFGVSGSGKSGVLRIGNAELKDRDGMVQEILKLGNNAPHPSEIIDLFTHVRARTAIGENGTAKKESLRFVRVVNQNKPDSDTEAMQFIAECSCPDHDEEMIRICKALRNIGTERTRGLGAVRCEYVKDKASAEKQSKIKPRKESEQAEMRLHILLRAPMMISSSSEDKSIQYIPGSAVLGAFASMYLKKYKLDEVFESLFLQGRVQYPNLYLSDKNGKELIPTPFFVRKLKSSDADVDGSLVMAWEDSKGAEPKPIRNSMIGRDLDEKSNTEVLTKTVYHHSRGKDGTLYTQSCMQENQYLSGVITGERNLLEILKSLLSGGRISIGKSKTAQYSECILVSEPLVQTVNKETETFKNGDKLILSFESDYVLPRTGMSADELMKEILPGVSCELMPEWSTLDYGIIHGYNTKRNMRNLPEFAVLKGSCIAVKLTVPESVSIEKTIRKGKKQAEGFGVIRVLPKDRVREDDKTVTAPVNDNKNAGNPAFAALLKKKAVTKKAVATAFDVYKDNKSIFEDTKMTASLIGRLILMVNESKTRENMVLRVESIKDTKKKDLCKELMKAIPEDSNAWKPCLLSVLRLARYSMKEEA